MKDFNIPINLLIFALTTVSIFLATAYPVLGAYTVNVNQNKQISKNKFSLGTQLTLHRLGTFPDSPQMQQLMKDANFKMVRIFDTWGGIRPCDSWNDVTMTCNRWDWSDVDKVVDSIFEVGAEPLITLVHCGGGPKFNVPSGMRLNPSTGLPYPASYAAYARAWVHHFKVKEYPVRYYEIINEVQFYLTSGGWPNLDTAKLEYYMGLYEAARNAMRQENSNVLTSFDFVAYKKVLDYWLSHGGAELDTLNFHKYDSGSLNQFNDQQLFTRAETQYFGTWPQGRSVMESQQLYYSRRGRTLPIINSESNLNSTFISGTDKRIVQMSGAVWTALVLRQGIVNGLSYNIFFTWAASLKFEQTRSKDSYGFGLINSNNNQPWYPYYVHKMVGLNLAVGDSVIESSSSNENIRTLAWKNNSRLNVLLIHKSTETSTVSLDGVAGRLSYQKIDDPSRITYLNPTVTTGYVNEGGTITLNGYTVMLLQSEETAASFITLH